MNIFEDRVRSAPDTLLEDLGFIALDKDAVGEAADALGFARWLFEHPSVCIARTLEEAESDDETIVISQIHKGLSAAIRKWDRAFTHPSEECYQMNRAAVKRMGLYLPRAHKEMESLWVKKDPRAFDPLLAREVIETNRVYGEALSNAIFRSLQESQTFYDAQRDKLHN